MNARRTEIVMPKGKLTPEDEVIAAYGAAMVAAFQVHQLPRRERRTPSGKVSGRAWRLHGDGESKRGDVSDMTLVVLHDIRAAILD
jgi:hypothetical protein